MLFRSLPFQAVHIPVQAPQAFIEPYMGVYDSGWDVLREQRLSRAVELGIVPEGAGTVRMSTTADWQALDEERRRYEAKRMAVYAGMVEAMKAMREAALALLSDDQQTLASPYFDFLIQGMQTST